MARLKSCDFILEPVDKTRQALLTGPEDENLIILQKRLDVTIAYSGSHFRIEGAQARLVNTAKKILNRLYLETAPAGKNRGKEVTPQMVHLALIEAKALDQKPEQEPNNKPYREGVLSSGSLDGLYYKADDLHTPRGIIRARTANQASYIRAILSHDVCFGAGPAGTGKTYLAVAAAVDALHRNEVRRIILTRPAIEAGEKLGFLPGDLTQKVDPYLRPLYDALYEMLGFEKVQKFIEKQVIEIAPLAYMRGRTLNDSFIILDEAQNTSIEQMKMFLTRIGFNSRAVVTGDPSQIDLPRNVRSGLNHALVVLDGVAGIAVNHFKAEDVVRHPVVAAIVKAYDSYEKKAAQKRAAEGQQKTLENKTADDTAKEKEDDQKPVLSTAGPLADKETEASDAKAITAPDTESKSFTDPQGKA